jgi:hypothetical protein
MRFIRKSWAATAREAEGRVPTYSDLPVAAVAFRCIEVRTFAERPAALKYLPVFFRIIFLPMKLVKLQVSLTGFLRHSSVSNLDLQIIV